MYCTANTANTADTRIRRYADTQIRQCGKTDPNLTTQQVSRTNRGSRHYVPISLGNHLDKTEIHTYLIQEVLRTRERDFTSLELEMRCNLRGVMQCAGGNSMCTNAERRREWERRKSSKT